MSKIRCHSTNSWRGSKWNSSFSSMKIKTCQPRKNWNWFRASSSFWGKTLSFAVTAKIRARMSRVSSSRTNTFKINSISSKQSSRALTRVVRSVPIFSSSSSSWKMSGKTYSRKSSIWSRISKHASLNWSKERTLQTHLSGRIESSDTHSTWSKQVVKTCQCIRLPVNSLKAMLRAHIRPIEKPAPPPNTASVSHSRCVEAKGVKHRCVPVTLWRGAIWAWETITIRRGTVWLQTGTLVDIIAKMWVSVRQISKPIQINDWTNWSVIIARRMNAVQIRSRNWSSAWSSSSTLTRHRVLTASEPMLPITIRFVNVSEWVCMQYWLT